LNNAGKLAVTARHRDEQGADVGRGIWAGLSDDLQLVARTGDAAPGVDGTFAQFSGPFESPLINGQGCVAFTARVTGPGIDEFNDTGIWAQNAEGRLQLVVREGQLGASQYASDDLLGKRLYFNNRGQVAFTVSNGVWATDLAGNIHSLVQDGDVLPFYRGFSGVLDSPVSFVATAPSTGNEDGVGTSFNDRGEFVFFAYSQYNNMGLFVSRAVAVPESAGAYLALAAVGALRPRRARGRGPGRPARSLGTAGSGAQGRIRRSRYVPSIIHEDGTAVKSPPRSIQERGVTHELPRHWPAGCQRRVWRFGCAANAASGAAP
jgi:hypothetical protein